MRHPAYEEILALGSKAVPFLLARVDDPVQAPLWMRIKSQPAPYNCVAWIEGLTDRFIDPTLDWPPGVPRPQSEQDDDLECYEALFRHFGYEVCADASLEDGYIKIALYAHEGSFEHVAKQMPSGKWTSKAGFLHDLNYDTLDAFANCGLMKNAIPVRFMRRSRTAAQKDQEWTVLLLPPLRSE